MITHEIGYKNSGARIGELCILIDLEKLENIDKDNIAEYLENLNIILKEDSVDINPWFFGINSKHLDLVCINVNNDFSIDVILEIFNFYNRLRFENGIGYAPNKIVIELHKQLDLDRRVLNILRNSSIEYVLSLIDDFTLSPAWINNVFVTYSNHIIESVDYTLIIKSPTIIELEDYIDSNLNNLQNISLKMSKVFSYTPEINLFYFLIRYGFYLNYASINDFELIKNSMDALVKTVTGHTEAIVLLNAELEDLRSRIE